MLLLGLAAQCFCQAHWSCSHPGDCPQTTAGLSASLHLASERASRRTWQRRYVVQRWLAVCTRGMCSPMDCGIFLLYHSTLYGVPSTLSRVLGSRGTHELGPVLDSLPHNQEQMVEYGCLSVLLWVGTLSAPSDLPYSFRLRVRRAGVLAGWVRQAWVPGCGPSAWSATRRAWCTMAGTTWSFSGGGGAGGGWGGSAPRGRARGPLDQKSPTPRLPVASSPWPVRNPAV